MRYYQDTSMGLSKFNQKEFNDFIIEHNVISFLKQPITLKSGRSSFFYVNWRNISNDVYLIDQLADYIISFVEGLGLGPDCFYGVPEGATKLAIITQYKWAKKQSNYNMGSYALSMGRGRKKEHGEEKDRYFLGMPEGNTIVIEDVTTTGSSLIATIDNLRKVKVAVISAIVITDRMEIRDDGKSIKQATYERGIPYYAMSNVLELFKEIFNRKEIEQGIINNINAYFERYGIEKL